MIPRLLQKYLFYIILFILVIGIVFISTKYMIQKLFPTKKIEGFDVPDGPGLTKYSNTTITLAPGITRFLTGGQSWTSSLNINHIYYGTTLNDTIKNDLNYYEPFINYFYTIATENGTDDETIPKLIVSNGGTNAAGWYVSTPTYGKITEKQLRRISGPIADRFIRVVYLMIKAEIITEEQKTFTSTPSNSDLVVGTYDARFGGRNCMGPNGTACSSAKGYADSAGPDYIKDGDNGAAKHWRADFIQTKLPGEWIANKPKMLALRTYAKLYEENPDFATNYLAHTPELGAYAEGAGMTVGMLLGGNLASTILMNFLYREVIVEVYEEIIENGVKVTKSVGTAIQKRGVGPALKGVGNTLVRAYSAGGGGTRGLITNLGKALVKRGSTTVSKMKSITALLKRGVPDAKIVAKGGSLGVKMFASLGRGASALKELSMVALGFDKSIKTIKMTAAAAKAANIAVKSGHAAAMAAQAAVAASTSMAALGVGIGTSLAANPVGWAIAILLALADIILMIVDLVPKEKFQELGIKVADKIIGDHMLKCPLGTMDGAALADDEFTSVLELLPLPANFAVQDIAMKKRLACMYTDTLGNTTMSQKSQCAEGNDDTCFAEAPLPMKVWSAIPEPVSRLTVIDLLDKIEDEIDDLSSDFITITGYEWAAVTAVNTMKSKLAANASDFLSSYNAAVKACNLVQYGKIWESKGRTGAALYGTDWIKEGRSGYNSWWSDISGLIQTTPVANVNSLTTPGNSDTFATRMRKNPFNWGDNPRLSPRFHSILDISCLSSGKYPDTNIRNFLSIANDDTYNDALAGGSTLPKQTRYSCQPIDFYRTIKSILIKALLRKEIEIMKDEMDKYPELIGKFADDPNLGDTSLSIILADAAATAANAAVEDAVAGRATPSTTPARNAAITEAVTAYNKSLDAFYPVNVSYTILSSFSPKINRAVWLTKLANDTNPTSAGGIYDASNTLILSAAGTTYEELDLRPTYISKFSTDVSGAYWNRKNLINASVATRQLNAINAWNAIKTDFTTANDPFAMTTVQWILQNVVPAKLPATATAAEKAAATKRFTDAFAPFQNTPSATINTIINNIITQLGPANKSPAVTSSNDFLAKYNTFLSEISYRNDELEIDKNNAYIKSITADAARLGYNVWKSKYIITAIEMDALATAKSLLFAFQTDSKKAEIAQAIIDTRAAYVNELINYNQGKDVRTFYINAYSSPGFKYPYYKDPISSAIGFNIEFYDGKKRGTVIIPTMEKVNTWFLTPNGAKRALDALTRGTSSLESLIAASKPLANEISSYGAVPTIGWKWDSGIECWQHTVNREPCGVNDCDGSTRKEYQWVGQKCINNGQYIKRNNAMGSFANFNLFTGDPKQNRMADYFKNVGGLICHEPLGQPVPTPCVAGEEFQSASMCLKNCKPGEWQHMLNCYYNCPSGTIPDPNGAKTNCITDCSGNYPDAISLVECSEVCSPGDDKVAPYCYAPCTNGWNKATNITCNRNSCDTNVGGYVDEGTPGFCHKKCAYPDEYPSAYAVTDYANKVSCVKACSFDNNDGQNLSLVNVNPISKPTEIGNCMAWLDATTFVNGSTTWNSASPSLGYNMTSGGGPTLVDNQLFTGSKRVLQVRENQNLSMTPKPVSTAFTMFFVSRQIGPKYGRVLTGDWNQLYGYWGSYKNQLHMNNWQSAIGGTGSNGTWDSYRVRRRGNGSGDFARFGSVISSFASSVGSLNGLNLNTGFCCGPPSGAEVSDAQIAEIIIYNRDLSDYECQQVENYLLAKWFKQRTRVPGYERCYKDCDNGWFNNRDLGIAHCQQDSCTAGQWDNGTGVAAVCYDPCPPDKPNPDRAAGTICYAKCPDGTDWDGATTCSVRSGPMRQDRTTLAASWMPAYHCPNGYADTGTWCQTRTHGCGWWNWGTCNDRDPPTTSRRAECPWNRPNLVDGLCYENCPPGQSMTTIGTCYSAWYCPSDKPYRLSDYCYANPAGEGASRTDLTTRLDRVSRGSRLKNRSVPNDNYDDRAIINGNLYWGRDYREKEQTIARSITKTLKTIGRESKVRPSYTAQYMHDINSVQGCGCVIANAWERANNGCGTFGLLTQYPAAPWGVAGWQVNTTHADVKSLMERLADFFVSFPTQLPDELFEEDHPLKNQGTPALERVIVLKPDKTEDTTMKNKLIIAYLDYINALNYKDDYELFCSAGFVETMMNDTLSEPALGGPGAGDSYLSRARMMYLMELGTNDEDFKSYLTRYDKWKEETKVAMSERILAGNSTYIDPFSRTFLDKLAQYLFDQTKTLLRGQFFHITKIFGLGYVSESCVELHCNANQYAAPPTASDADIPKSLTITPITNWVVRFYLSGGNPIAYEFQNLNDNAFMLTNKRCLYYTQNYVPSVYFNGYTHTCAGATDLQKQVDYYRKQNAKASVKYITAQKNITDDQTLCAMQWQEADYNPETNQDGSQMTSKSGVFVWSKKGMSETPSKKADGTFDFSTDDTVITNVLLTPSDISTEVYNRINDTDSATEKQSIMDGATKAMTTITPPITVATKLYKDEEDLEGCFPMKCSNPYIMNLILSKFNATTDPEGGTSKIITIKKIFTVSSGRCDMLANVISSTGVVEEQKRSVTMVTQKDAAGAIVPCKYNVSAIGAKGTGTFITDSLTVLSGQKTQAMLTYSSGPPITDAIAGAIDKTRTGLETVAKTAKLKSYAAAGSEKKFVDCPAVSCSSKDVLDAIVMQYNADNYPKTTANVLQKTMTKIFKVGTAVSVAGNATCDINFENTSQFYTNFPATPAGAANKTTITKRFQVTTSDACQYTVVSDITKGKTANLPKSSATDLTDVVNVMEDDPSFDSLAIVGNKPSTANSMALVVTRDTSGISYTGTCPTPNLSNPGVLLDIARFITAQNAANSLIVTTLYTPATQLSPTSCSLRVGYTRNGTATAYMNTFTVSFTKDITLCRYRITRITAGTEGAAMAGATPISSFVRPLNSCPSVPIPCTSPAVQNEAKSFYKSMMTILTNGISNTMNITKAAAAGTNTCEFQVSTQSGTATSTWDGTAANFSKFHFTFNFNPNSVCDGINYVAYDMKPVSSSQSSHTIGDKVPENVACYTVLDCNNASIKTKVTNALNAAGPSGTTYSITGTPVKTAVNKCEYLVSRTVSVSQLIMPAIQNCTPATQSCTPASTRWVPPVQNCQFIWGQQQCTVLVAGYNAYVPPVCTPIPSVCTTIPAHYSTTNTTTSQDKLSSYDSTLHRSVVFKAKTPIVVRPAGMSSADYTTALTNACYGSSGMDVSGTVDPVAQTSSRTYVPVSCPRIGTTSSSQTVFSHSSINAALVAALRNKYNDLLASGLLRVSFVKGGSFPITQINSITIDTANPMRITVAANYQRYEYRVVLNAGLAANASRVPAKAPAGNYNITQNDADYAWNPYIHPIINIFFYNTCAIPVITKENITFVASRATSLYRTF